MKGGIARASRRFYQWLFFSSEKRNACVTWRRISTHSKLHWASVSHNGPLAIWSTDGKPLNNVYNTRNQMRTKCLLPEYGKQASLPNLDISRLERSQRLAIIMATILIMFRTKGCCSGRAYTTCRYVDLGLAEQSHSKYSRSYWVWIRTFLSSPHLPRYRIPFRCYGWNKFGQRYFSISLLNTNVDWTRVKSIPKRYYTIPRGSQPFSSLQSVAFELGNVYIKWNCALDKAKEMANTKNIIFLPSSCSFPFFVTSGWYFWQTTFGQGVALATP